MENLVLFIEKEKFLRQMLEAIFKKKNANIHTEESISHHFYLIDDLKPKIIVFDIKTIGSDLDKLLSYEGIKFIAIGSENENSNLSPKISKFLAKPLPATGLFESITSNT